MNEPDLTLCEGLIKTTGTRMPIAIKKIRLLSTGWTLNEGKNAYYGLRPARQPDQPRSANGVCPWFSVTNRAKFVKTSFLAFPWFTWSAFQEGRKEGSTTNYGINSSSIFRSLCLLCLAIVVYQTFVSVWRITVDPLHRRSFLFRTYQPPTLALATFFNEVGHTFRYLLQTGHSENAGIEPKMSTH